MGKRKTNIGLRTDLSYFLYAVLAIGANYVQRLRKNIALVANVKVYAFGCRTKQNKRFRL